MSYPYDLVVLFEHPEWQKPLFAALERRGVRFDAVRSEEGRVRPDDCAAAPLVLQPGEPERLRARQHARGSARALVHAVARGSRARASSTARGVRARAPARPRRPRCCGGSASRTPRSIAFNDVEALRDRVARRARVARAAQAGAGRQRRAHRSCSSRSTSSGRSVERRPEHLAAGRPAPAPGVLRARSRARHRAHGVPRRRAALRDARRLARSLQPVPVARRATRTTGDGVCEIPAPSRAPPVEFYSVQGSAGRGRRCGQAHRRRGRHRRRRHRVPRVARRAPVFYDVNANSNLRPSIAQAFGFDPFERVVDFLAREIRAYESFLRLPYLHGRIRGLNGDRPHFSHLAFGGRPRRRRRVPTAQPTRVALRISSATRGASPSAHIDR